MIKLKGTTFYPPALDNLLHEIADIEDYGLSIGKDQWGNDQLKLFIQTSSPQETIRETIREQIGNICRQKLRVVPDISFLSALEMHRFLFPNNNRKPLRVKDLREPL